MRLTRAVVPLMLDAGTGSVVNVASEAGLRGSAAVLVPHDPNVFEAAKCDAHRIGDRCGGNALISRNGVGSSAGGDSRNYVSKPLG
jgi:NAD(P)-dependent dehydrogenase (short-subunit alcohol dehydrogenase family)